MLSRQRRIHVNSFSHHFECIPVPRFCTLYPVPCTLRRKHILRRIHSPHIQLRRHLPYRLVRLRMLRQRYQHAVSPQDSRLLARDQWDRVAQPLHVIERNISDH